jgi:hypothetical protein
VATFIDFADRLDRLTSSKFQTLRPAQEHVLSKLGSLHIDDGDVGVELPTGEGKTLIALLMGDWALDQGMSVAYLTGTRHLAEQVEADAAYLPGIEVRRFASGHYPAAHLDDYHQAQAIGVMNYWVYFNSSPRVEPADLVMFDDAHLAEQPLSGMFTLRIPRTSALATDLYTAVCDLVLARSPDTYPTLKALRDGTAPSGSPPELIAFNDWSAVAESAASLIDDSGWVSHEDEARYSWRAINPFATRCGVLVGPSAIEIRPYHPPTQTVPGYAKSSRRLYLSATLGRAGDLQRRLGVKPIVIVQTPEELSTASTGRRTLLINPTREPALEAGPMDFAAQQMEAAAADGPGRVAWLCASNLEADTLERALVGDGRRVFRLRAGDDSAVERWKDVAAAHLVTAGRFDGLDFADDVCRLVILPSVPAASSEFERFAVAYLGDATYMRHRVGQRVTQALGRANRTEGDSALYLGLDPAFGAVLAESAVRASLSRDVRGTVRSALELHGEGWGPVQAAAAGFWRTHRHPESLSEETPRARPGRRTAGVSTADSAGSEVQATTRLWLGDLEGAAQHAATAAEELLAAGEPEHSAFWRYVQAHALFERGGDVHLAAAKAAITEAVTSAPRTAWFLRLTRTAEELEGRSVDPTAHDPLFLAWDEWLRDSTARLLGQIAEARAWLTGSHDQRSDALITLARLCGAAGERPRGQSATDARWVWATLRKGHRRVWEVKTGASAALPREDVNQLLGQVHEERTHNPRAIVFGCLLTSLDDVEEDAVLAAKDDVVLFHTDAALVVFDRMAEVFTEYRTAWGSGSASERGAARLAVEARLPKPNWLVNLLAPSGGRIVRGDAARKSLERN